MRIGFVGTGVITKAVVTGWLRSGMAWDRITLSPRGEKTSAELAALDERIRIGASNQDVLDASDVVCLAVVPQIADEVLRELKFDSRHHVLSFIAGIALAKLERLVCPAASVVRVIPLPAVAEGKGSTAICPPDALAKTLFSAMGEAVEVEDEHQYDALQAVTATMASFYAVLESQAAWLVRQGLKYAAARAFLSSYCAGLAHEATRSDQSFASMIEGVMTPGGLNEQLHDELTRRGSYAHYQEALDRVLARVEGRE
ncbi:MAG TPA: pyrroline-5-carboxylate reductase [Paraburkholderia sp.]|nr:pyrroline-5-carboxylate reductase [Paraburkholderia sp.]